MTERKYADPIEEVARAMAASRAWPIIYTAGSARELARIALARLRELGMLGPLYSDAIEAKAEQDHQ
jgi:hypothetical protein